MTAPLLAKQTNYLKNNVPYYKYYETEHVPSDSVELYSSATATIGGQECYTAAYSFQGTGPTSGTFPSGGSGMVTSIATPSSYNNTNVTISAWIKPSSNNQSSKTIWGCHCDGPQQGISFGMDDGQAGKLKFHTKGYGSVLRSNSYLYANTWYFIVCVYDRTNMQKRIYINGVLDATQNFTSGDSDSNLLFQGNVWKVGIWNPNSVASKTSSFGASQCFPGNVLNACAWYRALTQEEITQLYNSGNGMPLNTSVAPYTDVAIAYPLNEETGAVAYSAITGQDTGVYGTNTTYNKHVQESVFAGSGVKPIYLYKSGDNWSSDLQVSAGSEFVSDLTLTKEIYPTKITVTLNNTTPKNPVNLVLKGSTDQNTWTTLGTVLIPSNTNQIVELDLSSGTEYKYYRVSTTQAYLTTGLTINNIKINGYWPQRSEVGKHSQWDEEIQAGTHTVIGTSSDYDTIEYQNREYEVQNV